MSRRQELTNMTERCRICLIDNGCMTSLHNESVETKLKDLTKCTCIDIKHEESLPSIICHVCLYKLNAWSEFKERFLQSNKILLDQLELSEASDNAIIQIIDSKEDRLSKNTKRKHLNKTGEDSTSEIEKKKSKADVSSSELASIDCVTDQIVVDTISISDDDGPNSSKNLSQKVLEIPDNNEKKDTEKCNEEHTGGKSSSGPMRARLLPMRRGRNIERRKASTKRWVERKKALLAATGENVSDTDSIASDEAQLSPVQKARAKTNADKEAERQKRIAKVLKNLETNLTEKYIALRDGDTDSDTRRTRLSKELHSNTLQKINKNSLLNQADKKNEKSKSSLDNSMGKTNSLVSLARKNVTADSAKKSESQVDEGIPNLLKSELVVGDTTYAVTSTLILVDPSHINKEDLNNLTKESKSLNVDENSHEKNTDIIDAVQLRRVNPVTTNIDNKSNGKNVERCLNIEVEGNELSVLKRVQVELADFVQKEMKQKLFGTTSDDTAKTDKTDSGANSCQKLDQKLKSIIEKAIKKNIESSVMRDVGDCGQRYTRISPAVAKAAVTLPKYQPKVLMKRLNITQESKLYNINNVHVLKQAVPRTKLAGPFSVTLRKRQSVPPIRYNDYNTSALESDSEESDDAAVQKMSKASNPTTQGGTTKSGENSQIVITKRIGNNSTVKTVDNGASIVHPSDSTNEQKADYEEAIRIEGAIAENHICGVCGLTFNTRKDVEAHVRTHKQISSTPASHVVSRNVTTPTRQVKQKMMRCKRCHEIVEARFVKAHVCKTTETHKCYVCNSMFRTEKLLVRHLESHDQSEFNITLAIESKKSSNIEMSEKTQPATPQKEQEQRFETPAKTQIPLTEKNDIQSDKITSTGVKLDNAENIIEKPKETYTCFVCDKIFTDEEVLKDHLQKHCDDLSEGEQSNSKEQYQCAICGSTLESDQALEEHVGKHLFDDEDDNPNLISINQDNKNNNKEAETYHCGQCSETFNSEVLLEMHMQAHEEDIAIAEWEKQGMKVYQYQCMLCDELFNTEEELAEHLDVHNANAQVCQLCDKPFRTLEDLQEHVATH